MWRSPMFWRLFVAHGVLLAAAVGLLGWILLSHIENRLLAEIHHNLETKTALLVEIAAASYPGAEERQRQVERLGQETQMRITLLAADGKVLADSAEDPEQMENHAQRPEVRDAQESGAGTATRYSTTTRQDTMYVARRMNIGPVRFVRAALPLEQVHRELAWLRTVIGTAVGLTLISALAISLVVARRVTRPLVELADAARALAQGQCTARVAIASRDEVGTLAAAFNEMSEACTGQIGQIERDREQLRAILGSMVEGVLVIDAGQTIRFLNEAAARFLGVSRHDAEGRKLWQLIRHRQFGEGVERILGADEPFSCELEWNVGESQVLELHGARLPGPSQGGAVLVLHDITHLRELERVRQDFVANVSHELKTPLATIHATVETLLDGAVYDAGHNIAFLRRIQESSERLHHLVQDLLTLSRIESGQETLHLQPIPVRPAIESCLSHHESRAAAKQLSLDRVLPAEFLAVSADEEALAVILDNLVDNAIKYTPSGGKISVSCAVEDAHAVLLVMDTGLGMPEKELPRIFERFYRVDKARSRELGGTGLGLSIVKHLTQAMNGSIHVSSKEGQGSTFTIRLPLAVEARRKEAG